MRPKPSFAPSRFVLPALALLLSSLTFPASAEERTPVPPPKNSRHALVIGIGEYLDPAVPSLGGVRFDMDSARRMANAMAIPDANIVYIRDRDATAERIRKEIAALNARTRPGDRVFFYYSGHGTRWYDPDNNREGCTEGLLAADRQALTNREISEQLKLIAAKSDKLMVFYDACFSGGVASAPFQTRAITLGQARITPKFTPVGAPEMCAKPSNFKTRALTLVQPERGGIPENVVHIAASRSDEVSFDNPKGGGFATSAFRDCMLGDARDLDGSGAVNVDEIARCAQRKLDTGLAGQPGIEGQHMTVAGNKGFVPASIAATFLSAPATPVANAALATVPAAVTSTSAASSAASAPVASNTPQPVPATSSSAPENRPAAAQASSAAAMPAATPAAILAEIHQQRDGARTLEVKSTKTSLRIERDKLELTVSPGRDGYLYIALAGSDNKSLYLVYPNALDTDNRVRAGVPVQLPRQSWEIVAGGPVGTDTLLVMVSDSPRAIDGLAAQQEGPFMKTLLDAQGRARLQWFLTNSATSGGSECGSAERLRNLLVTRKCSDAFASALLRVEEVR